MPRRRTDDGVHPFRRLLPLRQSRQTSVVSLAVLDSSSTIVMVCVSTITSKVLTLVLTLMLTIQALPHLTHRLQQTQVSPIVTRATNIAGLQVVANTSSINARASARIITRKKWTSGLRWKIKRRSLLRSQTTSAELKAAISSSSMVSMVCAGLTTTMPIVRKY